jgi:mannitol/fructose-specific phosphotransferase system IIA component
MSPEDLESLEETLAVLEDSEAVTELVEAHRVEAVKALWPK